MKRPVWLFCHRGPVPKFIQVQTQAAVRTDVDHRVASTPQRGRRFAIGGATLVDRQRDTSHFERHPDLSEIDNIAVESVFGTPPGEHNQIVVTRFMPLPEISRYGTTDLRTQRVLLYDKYFLTGADEMSGVPGRR
ncbi:MAG: hypothetical protein KGO50_15630 [Myxococcales bacterium]|nr:hypothetical protein [Myxococcales bacterium]